MVGCSDLWLGCDLTIVMCSHFVAEVETDVDGAGLLSESGGVEVVVHANTPVGVNLVVHTQVNLVLLAVGSVHDGVGLVVELGFNSPHHPGGQAEEFIMSFVSVLETVEDLSGDGGILDLFGAASHRDDGGTVVLLVLKVSAHPAEDLIRALIGELSLRELHALVFSVHEVGHLSSYVPLVSDDIGRCGKGLLRDGSGLSGVAVDSQFSISEEGGVCLLISVELSAELSIEVVLGGLVVPHASHVHLVAILTVDLSFELLLDLLAIEVH